MRRRDSSRSRAFRPTSLLRRTLRRRGLEVATWSILLVAIVVSTAYVQALSTYESSLLYRVAAPSGAPGGVMLPPAETLETMTRLVASGAVLDGAAEDPAVGDIPWFRDVLRVESIPGTPLIRVAARGTPEQAPRILGVVIGSLERLRAREIRVAEGEVRDRADSRLDELRARAVEVERTWKDFARRKGEGSPELLLDVPDLHRLADERVAIRLGIVEAESQRAMPRPEALDLGRLHRLTSSIISTHPVGLAWFWALTGLVATIVPAGVLGLAMTFERKRAAEEARRLREQSREAGPNQGPLLVAIQLVHGDWRPHPAS